MYFFKKTQLGCVLFKVKSNEMAFIEVTKDIDADNIKFIKGQI